MSKVLKLSLHLLVILIGYSGHCLESDSGRIPFSSTFSDTELKKAIERSGNFYSLQAYCPPTPLTDCSTAALMISTHSIMGIIGDNSTNLDKWYTDKITAIAKRSDVEKNCWRLETAAKAIETKLAQGYRATYFNIANSKDVKKGFAKELQTNKGSRLRQLLVNYSENGKNRLSIVGAYSEKRRLVLLFDGCGSDWVSLNFLLAAISKDAQTGYISVAKK